MHQLKRNNGAHAACLLVIMNLLVGSLVPVRAVSNGQRRARSNTAQTQPNSPDQMLKLGYFYFNNDDISDKAAVQFRTVIAKYPKSSEAETAQYYLGSYYQRKYYVQLNKFRKQDTNALESAKREYRIYTDKYYKSGSHQWLSDAFFNLALVYLQAGDTRNAGYELSKMSGAASTDDTVFIYQVVYSQAYDDVIDGTFSARRLAEFSSSLVRDPKQSFSQQVAAIKRWCRSQGAKAA